MDIKEIERRAKIILRRLNTEDREEILQNVILNLLRHKPVVKYKAFYSICLKNEMVIYLNKKKSDAQHEHIFAANQLDDQPFNSPFNDVLSKQLKNLIKKDPTVKTSGYKKVLDYMLDDKNEGKSIVEMASDLNFNSYDTAKSNVNLLRDKLKKHKEDLKT